MDSTDGASYSEIPGNADNSETKPLNFSDPDRNSPQNTTGVETTRLATDMDEIEHCEFDSVLSYDNGRDEIAGGKRDGLNTIHVAGYAVGHLNNDLCAAIWFNYLSYYVSNVVGLSNGISGLCLLSG